MTVKRLASITGIGLDIVAAAAGSDPDVLRLENLDTDLPVPAAAQEATRAAIINDAANSWLPLTGRIELRSAVAQRLYQQTGHSYNAESEIVITCGGMEGLLDTLLATTDPGDEVVLTDPTYAGMINRVRLVGAIPRFVPFVAINNEWRLDLDALHTSLTNKTRALFIMNPSMPSGAVLNEQEWEAIATICRERSIWLIYNAAMERILFDGHPYLHPAAMPCMSEHTITIGSVSKEFRMIGWRTGWVVGPATIMSDIAHVHIYNVATPTGIAQTAAVAALTSPDEELAACVSEWQRRRDTVVEQLRDMSVIPAAGGWSLLLNVGLLGYDSSTASQLLLERGKVAATYMRDWGKQNSDQFVRLVFSNEPVERLQELRQRVNKALSGIGNAF